MNDKQRNQVLAVLFIGVLMGALDIAIIGPAMPTIRQQFGWNERQGTWIFGIYVLFNLIGTPLMAKLSDLFGRRWIYVLDVVLFGLGSLIVALSSPSFPWTLLLGRGIQGFGAGGIFPVASAVIGDTFPPEKRGGALGLIGAVFGIAFLFGPPIGGVVTRFAGWHWLFLINLPIALVLIIFALRLLPAAHSKQVPPFDWAGMAVMSLMLSSLAYAINQLDKTNFISSLVSLQVGPFLLIFIFLLVMLIQIEKKTEYPILPPHLFGRRQLTLAYMLSAGAGIGEVSMVFIPEMVKKGLNIQDPAVGSLMMMPVIVAMAIGSPAAGRFLDKFGSKAVILVGTSVMTLGMILMSLLSTSMVGFIIAGLLIGLGLSALLGAPIRYIMLNEADSSERSLAQGVVALFTSTGQLLSGALVGALAVGGNYAPAFLVIGLMGILLIGLAAKLKNRSQEIATVQKQ